ncbi:phage tail protein [Pediococcus pentosaceus]|uniref:major tail protein n=1 Tax=Pediococcus pentosaceus TaxID=1255 RepID=UPI00232AD021|nr:major tail protein [Pediococcus pentosaceus]MDB1563003.1 phage tail protein [Pediococcus pentosaceus]
MAEKYGFRKAITALIDKDTEQIITGAEKGLSENGLFTIDASTSKGVISGAITGLAPTQTKVYGSDAVVDIIAQGTGAVSLTLAANDIPMQILGKLSGMDYDATTGAYKLGKDSKPPFSVVDLVSTDGDKHPIHFALYKGKFGPEEVSLNTNQDQVNRATDSVTFSAVNRNSDGFVYAMYVEDETHKEEDILKDIFKGYAAVPAAPASN